MYSDVYELVLTTGDRELLMGEIDILVNNLYKTEALASEVRSEAANVLGGYKDQLWVVREVVKKMREIKLEVARELPQKAVEEISRWVRKYLGEDVVMEFKLKPELIGGATVYWEGRYGDFSLKKKLESYFSVG
ncbi:MAG: hypothetical protein UX99_C0033G0007 [Candidatus Amesbacteria bacterium GW2011_GWB1_47_26]|uniref:Uncharacterized protein n=1 Tax=Candidatus Amesbacteria bacterium GW2011_GWC2_45_19 TaxID=1618366 RepID=A0A0G1M3E2_9BACT|nr:MAG: hypothetical protein UX05_C0008G0033 [Candidatus Amesbacteria bacterium GW2011_GWC2_45_19]KKU37633.1 MAG: hypothetical protein UX52_C0021G0015 [Candidatus Amesbacteria bacterium GW2011_GWA1_46_35]KKU68482.1 MAG: hypothetical protein UX93_C0007G0034 [Microgenomates group bacterium GW2011_GWC1_47_20]KKU73200.1 MAG: hypothetical protein UX99_C0033G0007 [Candidatus Amesbacteria bacterium GW2011_GWB1_47_26]KKU78642.1 MAG: hypothetical protein UY06_C0044G0005 [Candidatus Amesbacteria bacteriu